MNEVHCITNKRKTAKNEWENDTDFYSYMTWYIKNQGNFFSMLYSITCLNKDASVSFMKYKNICPSLFKNTLYMCMMPLINKVIKFQEKEN